MELIKKFIFPIIIVAAVSFAYFNSLRVPFIYDDLKAVMGNYGIRTFDPVKIFVAYPNRSFNDLTFSLNYLFNRFNPLWYHIGNIVIHILNGFAFLLLLKKIPGFDSKRAFCAAMIFLLNPVNVESVTYISSRSGMLSALFMMLGLFFFIDSKLVISLIFFGVSALSKEWGLVFPFMLIAYLYIYKRPGNKSELFSFIKSMIPAIIFWCLIFSLRKFQEGTFLKEELSKGYFKHILTHINASVEYVRLLLFPFNLNVDHYYPLVQDPTIITFFGFLLIAGAFFIAVSERFESGIRFFILVYFISFFPVVFVTLSDILVERWLYVPSMAFAAIVVLVFGKLFSSSVKTKRQNIFEICFYLVVFISLLSLTVNRNNIWVNEIRLWQDSVKKSPLKSRPYNNLGVCLLDLGYESEAEKIFYKAIDLEKDGYIPYSNLGLIYGKRRDYKNAAQMLRKSIELKPDNAFAHNNLGNVYKELGDLKSAYKEYTKAIELEKNYADAYGNLAILYEIQGRKDLAIEALKKAFEIEPNKYEWLNHLGVIYLEISNFKEALDTFDKGLKSFPDNPELRNNKGITYMKLKNLESALNEFNLALKVNPAFINAILNKGTALKELGRIDEAVDAFLASDRVNGNLPAVKFNIAHLYYLKGMYDESEKWFRKLLRLDQKSFEAYEYLGRIENIRGNREEAIKNLEEAIRYGDTKNDIKEMLSSLKK
ncbi:MAG: tetratricopeptide repeat protein [Candidatus Schekmanbacteria bacterium]|nr:tetratricopeptide repeat protein [Candidatus Schekmanbacteria bacterium]